MAHDLSGGPAGRALSAHGLGQAESLGSLPSRHHAGSAVRPAAVFDLPRGVVVPVRDIELSLLPGDHPFAERNREAARANWQREIAAKPALFDGRITLFASMHIADGVLSGTCHMTDYSSFLH